MKSRRQSAVQPEDSKLPLEQDSILCTELGYNIWSLLALKDLNKLGFTCKFFHSQNEFQSLLMKRAADIIVINPSTKEIRRMLNVSKAVTPAFLKKLLQAKVSKVINRNGQTIPDRTLFQLAFGEGDFDMCSLFKPYFKCAFGSIKAAKAEIYKQLNKKMGKGNKEQDDLIKNKFDALLQSVIQAISNEQFNLGRDANNKLILSPATLVAITRFREEFEALLPKVIDKGMHFRLKTLQETYDTYVQAAGPWGYSYNRCALFEDGVLSSVLSKVPGNDAQKFSKGLYYLQKEQPEDFTRSLTLRGSGDNFYDYLRARSGDFVLSGSCVDIIGVLSIQWHSVKLPH